MKWETRITKMLGCEYPILLGVIGRFGTSAIAAPVSEAGGFGIIAASALKTTEKLRDDIRRCRDMTDKPFGVSFSTRIPQIDEMLEVAIEERVAAIETSVYRADHLGRRIQEASIPWLHKVASVNYAISTDQFGGPDALGVLGIDGGGSKSPTSLPTMTQIPMVVKQVKVPVLASGNIGDGRGFLAALIMGAEGVILGTTFMATKECSISEDIKQQLVEDSSMELAYRHRAFGMPDEIEMERRRRGERPVSTGKGSYQPAGSFVVGLIHRIKTCREVIDDIISEAEAILAYDSPLARIGATYIPGYRIRNNTRRTVATNIAGKKQKISDGHTGGFNTDIKVARGEITFVLGYLVEGEEASFWLHVKLPAPGSESESNVAEALKRLGFKRFGHCGLVSSECYYINLRGREPIRPRAGAPVEALFDKLVKELPGIINNPITAEKFGEFLDTMLGVSQGSD